MKITDKVVGYVNARLKDLEFEVSQFNAIENLKEVGVSDMDAAERSLIVIMNHKFAKSFDDKEDVFEEYQNFKDTVSLTLQLDRLITEFKEQGASDSLTTSMEVFKIAKLDKVFKVLDLDKNDFIEEEQGE